LEPVGGQQVFCQTKFFCQTKSADGFFYLITGELLESIGELIVSGEPHESKVNPKSTRCFEPFHDTQSHCSQPMYPSFTPQATDDSRKEKLKE